MQAERWEHGSELHLMLHAPEERAPDPWAPRFHALASGRDAFHALLLHGKSERGWKRLFVPSYYCQKVVASLARAGIPLQLYVDGPDMRQANLDPAILEPGDVVLVVNFFGLRDVRTPSAIDRKDVEVIEDHTHDPWSTWARQSKADWCVASLRKAIPVPDGGVVWSPAGHSLPPAPALSPDRELGSLRRLAAMLMKSMYLQGGPAAKDDFRRLYLEAEATLDVAGHSAMTQWGAVIAASLPLERMRDARRRNREAFARRLEGLRGVRMLEPESDDGCPLSCLLLMRSSAMRDAVRERLAQSKVYAAVLWPLEDPVLEGVPEQHRNLSRRMLSIHCDIRYDERDMERVADLVHRFVHEFELEVGARPTAPPHGHDVAPGGGRKGALRWLWLDNEAEHAEWDGLWESSAYRRPHDHAGFLALVRPERYRPGAAVYEHAGGARVIYPFFCIDLDGAPEFAGLRRPLQHMASPYGYGGALYEGDPSQRDEVSACFEYLFHKEIRERGVVSEFVREDLFSSRLALRTAGETVEHQPNVVVRLDREPDDIWRHYKNTVRTNVKRAQSAGLRIAFDPTGQHLDAFLQVYYDTMKRRNAPAYYFMPRERFQYLNATLGRNDGLSYLHVYDGNDIVASELLLFSGDAMYAFLSASLESAFANRPNDFMRHEAILWGRRNGFRHYVLGGGATPNDGIYRFKQSFDPGSVLPFRVRKVIHDRGAYQQLLDARRETERARGVVWSPRQDFFPAYLS